jgi:hypothetical protein
VNRRRQRELSVSYLGDGSDEMVQIICNIHQVTELCQRKFSAKKPTGTAAYLLKQSAAYFGQTIAKSRAG